MIVIPELQKALQEHKEQVNYCQRIEMTSDLDRSIILKSVLKADMDNIKATIQEVDNAIFEKVVDSILKLIAYILGLRSAAP